MAEYDLRVMLVGSFYPGGLEYSYETAFRSLGCDVHMFNIAASIGRYCRFGRLGRLFHGFVPVEPWIRKANRDMVLEAQQVQPDIAIVFGESRVRAGALAQLRAQRGLKTVYVWPDTLINLGDASIEALPMYDLVATYGRHTVSLLERLGARRAEWVPFGGDPHLHSARASSASTEAVFGADIAFIGNWRPEREGILRLLLSQFGDSKIKIWGVNWGRHCCGKAEVLRVWQRRALLGGEFASAALASKINLNMIDPMNYPAANMRFFEIPCAGGLQVCSHCPEMESEFKHGETVFYYRDVAELPVLIRTLLSDDDLRLRVAKAAHERLLLEHTYVHRALRILELLNERSM